MSKYSNIEEYVSRTIPSIMKADYVCFVNPKTLEIVYGM